MRKLLNTLYVLSPNAYLQKDGENVVVRIDDQESFRIPIINLESIISFSYLGASPGLMNLCTRCGVTLSFHTPRGQYIGSLEGEVRGNVLLRRTQFRYADDEVMSSHYAAAFIAGKIANQRSVLARFLRDHRPEDSVSIRLQEVITQLKILIQTLSRRSSRAQVMGVEGTAAQLYFGVFQHLILNKEFSFSGRSKRPPKDAINTLLSLFYTMLSHDVRSALNSVGLDPYVGFLHTDRPGRPSLALDLMEELRAYMVDRFVLSIVNKRQVRPSDFIEYGEEEIRLRDETCKDLIGLWQKRKKEEITHPYLNERIPLGLLPYTQAMLLAKAVRGELEDYPVFLIQ